MLPGAEAEATVVARAFKDKGSNVPGSARRSGNRDGSTERFSERTPHSPGNPWSSCGKRAVISTGVCFAGRRQRRHPLRLRVAAFGSAWTGLVDPDSACETALGRVDLGDNLRGLSANALVAGAATIIGTLWPVDKTAARAFFGSLYGELREGHHKTGSFPNRAVLHSVLTASVPRLGCIQLHGFLVSAVGRSQASARFIESGHVVVMAVPYNNPCLMRIFGSLSGYTRCSGDSPG